MPAQPPETMECPSCGKLMIRTGTGTTLASYPPQYPMIWWCGCGHQESAGIERAQTDNAARRETWERVNAVS